MSVWRNLKLIDAISFMAFMVIILFFSASHAQTKMNIYIWDFGLRNGERNEFTNSCTVEFEEALVRGGCYTILQRRAYHKLLSQKQNEKTIMNIEGITASSLQNLKILEANGVIFGEVYDDVNSGEIKISITLQMLDGRIALSESVKFSRGKRQDAESREGYLKQLGQKACHPSSLEGMPTSDSVSSIKKSKKVLLRTKIPGATIVGHFWDELVGLIVLRLDETGFGVTDKGGDLEIFIPTNTASGKESEGMKVAAHRGKIWYPNIEKPESFILDGVTLKTPIQAGGRWDWAYWTKGGQVYAVDPNKTK